MKTERLRLQQRRAHGAEERARVDQHGGAVGVLDAPAVAGLVGTCPWGARSERPLGFQRRGLESDLHARLALVTEAISSCRNARTYRWSVPMITRFPGLTPTRAARRYRRSRLHRRGRARLDQPVHGRTGAVAVGDEQIAARRSASRSARSWPVRAMLQHPDAAPVEGRCRARRKPRAVLRQDMSRSARRRSPTARACWAEVDADDRQLWRLISSCANRPMRACIGVDIEPPHLRRDVVQ